MTTWVCFLRGINVGGHRKIPMAVLRQVLTDATADLAPQTYIASGNAVFWSDKEKPALTDLIGQAIETTFGFSVPVLLLSAQEVRDVLAACPCPQEQGNLAHAYLCFSDPNLDMEGVEELRVPSEVVTVSGQTVWLHAPEGIGRSKLAAKLEKLIGVEATARNLNTIRKMVAMVDG